MCGLITILIFGFLAYSLWNNRHPKRRGTGVYKNPKNLKRNKKNDYLKGRY